MRRVITRDTWQQIFTAYAAGIPLREMARRVDIPEVTVLQHAHRHGWTRQIHAATTQPPALSSNVITPVQSAHSPPQSVPHSVASILHDHKSRSKYSLSRWTAEAAEEAAQHPSKLSIAGRVQNVANVHSALWPEDKNTRNNILNLAVLAGECPPLKDAEPEERAIDMREAKAKELPSPVIEKNEKVPGASSPAMDCDSPNATNPTISRAPASANARPSAGDASARSAYREKCMYWRRYIHAY